MSSVARPIACAYFTTEAPSEIALIATVWPGSIGSTATAPPGKTVPGSIRPLATATLSAGDNRILLATFTGWGSWMVRGLTGRLLLGNVFYREKTFLRQSFFRLGSGRVMVAAE
jgi:hypothetical protein